MRLGQKSANKRNLIGILVALTALGGISACANDADSAQANGTAQSAGENTQEDSSKDEHAGKSDTEKSDDKQSGKDGSPGDNAHEDHSAHESGDDFSKGGKCTDGQDVVVYTSNTTPKITGNCGSVRIEGTGIKGTVESAQSVAVRGEKNTISGAEWGTVIVEGVGIKVTPKKAQGIEVNGKDVTVDAGTVTTISTAGESLTTTVDKATSVRITGIKQIFTADSIDGELHVAGDDNTVTWKSGIKEANTTEGKGNEFKR
ncbi:DUF3060 domain-containing protein [Timonella sp. A28]|uniref:DUF3060 domain-containing protein n=1 Tax=Timonella sp. A28 TaxID=3442640 RepID=UPI003EB8225F